MYLPLAIKKSSIDGAGLGVFATERLGRRSLICCYKCLYGTSYSINAEGDSNFTVGWGFSNNKPMELLADGTVNAGIGRFINSRN